MKKRETGIESSEGTFLSSHPKPVSNVQFVLCKEQVDWLEGIPPFGI